MKKIITISKPDATAMVEAAWQTVWESFDQAGMAHVDMPACDKRRRAISER